MNPSATKSTVRLIDSRALVGDARRSVRPNDISPRSRLRRVASARGSREEAADQEERAGEVQAERDRPLRRRAEQRARSASPRRPRRHRPARGQQEAADGRDEHRAGSTSETAVRASARPADLCRSSAATARAGSGTPPRGRRRTTASRGSSTSQCPSTKRGQRGWKRQPNGGLIGFGTSPSSTIALPLPSEPRVRDRHGREERSRVRVLRLLVEVTTAAPTSATLPRYITITRSEMWRTTFRSCAMNR